MSNCKRWYVLSWNVRGLGDSDKCTTVRESLCSSLPSFVCLQETKLCDLSPQKALGFLPRSLPDFLCLNASGTRGGIVRAWNGAHFTLLSSVVRSISLKATFSSTSDHSPLTITNVYAPSDHRLSPSFLQELVEVRACVSGPWLLIGDFNLVREASDKNNGRVDAGLCSLFNDALDRLEVLELPLLDCQFTWSNEEC